MVFSRLFLCLFPPFLFLSLPLLLVLAFFVCPFPQIIFHSGDVNGGQVELTAGLAEIYSVMQVHYKMVKR